MTTDKKSLFETAYKEGRNFLLEHEALQIFEAAGVVFPPNKLTKDVDEAVAFAKKIGYPIVIKAMSPQILHKSDFKAVEIGITDEGALKAKYEAMKARLQKFALNGILVEK
ncbi:MAG: acetate--CoA ligase family protein, partial [Candidatus Heimdallarchaeota archaeon]